MNKGEVFCFADLANYSDGAVVSKAIIQKDTGSITLFTFDKEEGLSEHTAPFDALVQIVEGKADIIIDKKSNILNADDSIIMPANIPRALK